MEVTSWTNVGSPITILEQQYLASPVLFRTIPATPTWSDLTGWNGTNFRIQAYRPMLREPADTYIDYLCIRVTLKADVVTEPWYTTFKNSDGTTKTVNISTG